VNEERTGKCLRQVEYIRGHLWHRYSIAVNQVMVVTAQFSKWWLQLFIPGFWWGSCYSIFSFICMFCWSLFVLLYFFFWPLCCLFFFDIRILIAPLVSSNSSYTLKSKYEYWTRYIDWLLFNIKWTYLSYINEQQNTMNLKLCIHVNDFPQVGGFLRVFQFPPPIKKNWPPRYNWNIVESGIKHHSPTSRISE
jgi:hypothetical protein